MINLQRLDLNLLVTLDILLTEHNVTRAADRLNLSQPTARADALREPLRQALESLALAVPPPEEFNPVTATNTWRIAASDYGESAILLPLLERLRVVAPATKLAVLGLRPADLMRQTEHGEIDLALHTGDNAPPGLRCRTLFKEHYVLTGRPGHPLLNEHLTLEQFCSLEHAIVSPDGGGFWGVTDEALAAAGVKRNVVLSVPHFLFIMSVLARTDMVAMLPARLAQALHPLRIVEAPLAIPDYSMTMLWHERVHRDPAQAWLRQFIADSI